MSKEERGALEEDMRKLDVCDVEKFCRLESSEKTIAILGGKWQPQTAKQDGDRISKQFLCHIWKKRNEHPNVGGVSIRSRNGAPSRKGFVVNGQMARQATNEYPPPLVLHPPHPHPHPSPHLTPHFARAPPPPPHSDLISPPTAPLSVVPFPIP